MPKGIPKKSKKLSERRIRPALTPEAREQQLISLAMDLVEQRLLDGTATSQETTHFLKLGSSKYRRELEKLEEENELLRAKTETLQAHKTSEELYAQVIACMKDYAGYGEEEVYDD